MPERGGLFAERERGTRVQRQIVLPWSKAAEISWKSLKLRFWRSIITMSGIILAIAFLMSVWTNNALVSAFKQVGSQDSDYNSVRTVLMKMKEDLSTAAKGMDAKNIWLIILSLVVCVVGIVNAMLMSVTERIREIGTMKCLGALDGFIVKLFLLESSFQGLAGTIIGIGIGFVLTFLRAALHFRGAAFSHFPAGAVAMCAAFALLIGAGLSVFAAIFPAYRAAHMQPVDAMRVEE
jgi:ABC-type antimicrobial peptide transport system permease subunit